MSVCLEKPHMMLFQAGAGVRQKNRTARKIIPAALVVACLGGCGSSAVHTASHHSHPAALSASQGTASSSPAPSPTPTPSPPPAPLTSTESVTHSHPMTGTKVGVQVSTTPGARITVVAHFETGDREKTARADATGLHTFWFPVGSAPPGIRVIVAVRVTAHGQKHSTRVWFTPRQPPPPPAPRTTAPAPPPPPSGCYPKASTGNCYEPGEFCPHADAGMSGVAGNGEAIICEDNNGLRWEPA